MKWSQFFLLLSQINLILLWVSTGIAPVFFFMCVLIYAVIAAMAGIKGK